MSEFVRGFLQTMNNYTIQHFIEKFKAIPEDKWITGMYGTYGDKHCALGHCGQISGRSTLESSVLSRMFATRGMSVVNINDGPSPRFPQDTPKRRILAALESFDV